MWASRSSSKTRRRFRSSPADPGSLHTAEIRVVAGIEQPGENAHLIRGCRRTEVELATAIIVVVAAPGNRRSLGQRQIEDRAAGRVPIVGVIERQVAGARVEGDAVTVHVAGGHPQMN